MIPPPRQFAAARVLAGLSQAELAKRARVAESAILRYETGKSDPRVTTIAAMMRALAELGVEFLDETDDHEMGVAVRKRRSQL
jgi:predicted transcriptional regulator